MDDAPEDERAVTAIVCTDLFRTEFSLCRTHHAVLVGRSTHCTGWSADPDLSDCTPTPMFVRVRNANTPADCPKCCGTGCRLGPDGCNGRQHAFIGCATCISCRGSGLRASSGSEATA